MHACTMHKALHQRLVTLNNAHQRNQPWPIYKEIHLQQQSRRDRDRQQRGIETPEERRRLERLKQNRESGTQEDALIS